jgi:hypothetical protein
MRETWDFDYSHGGWDWNMRLGVMGDELFCVFPRRSRSTHIGEFDGTHMHPKQFKETQAGTFVEERDPTDYRLVGYLDFWDGVLSDTPAPFDPSRSLPPSVGNFQAPPPMRSPNNPAPKAICQPPVPHQ